MKTVLKSIAVCGVALVTTALTPIASAKLPDAVYMDAGVGASRCIEILEPIVSGVAEQGQRGDTLPIYDADTTEHITTLHVPDTKVYNKPKPRRILRANLPARHAIKAFCDQPEAEDKSTLLPDTLRFIGKNAPRLEDDETYDILIAGHARVIDPRSPSTAMTGGLVPGDGHYRTARIHSPYGTMGEQKLLENVRVHVLTPDLSWVMTPAHGSEVERAIAVQVTERGGKLASYESDIYTLLNRIDQGMHNRIQYRPVSQTDHKLVMVDYSAPPPTELNIFDRSLSTERLSETELFQPLHDVIVGIAWTCDSDQDLVAMHSSTAPPLYWNNTATRDGRFLKDFRTANAQRGFETVEFSRPVNLTNLRLAVNLYSGENAAGCASKIRIAVGARTFEAPFTLPATHGNKGAGLRDVVAHGAAPNDAWRIIDPIAIVRGQ